jgi:hypothetical protein
MSVAPASPARALDSLGLLRHPGTIRARCAAVLAAVDDERSAWFGVRRERLTDAAARVAALTRRRFPDLARIPPHSRWRHFEAGGIDRKAELDTQLAGRGSTERLRAQVDLTVLSVLLDAGAGPTWRYADADGQAYGRSEGLAVASFRAFMAGRFSAIEGEPCRVDAGVLSRLDAAALREIFQVRADNPMVGLEGRAALVARLGRELAATGADPALPKRPAQLVDRLGLAHAGAAVDAAALLAEVLRLTEGVFTQGVNVLGRSVGDVWAHRWAGNTVAGGGQDPVTGGVVPFHKLSQWLAYSLLEPLQWAGVQVSGSEALTGLPEYRNGGLLLDTGVIVPRDARLLQRSFKPGDEPIVEWRALTVALLDLLAERVRDELGVSAEQMPLACVLEGGTWAAGREIALEKRDGGAPPLKIESDGTVF